MIRFRQHIPAYVDTDMSPREYTAETTAELLAQPGIARCAKDDPWARREADGEIVRGVRKWHRFSVADRHCQPTLMGEWDNGDYCWVLGYIHEGAERLELPDWKETETARKRRDNWNAGITT